MKILQTENNASSIKLDLFFGEGLFISQMLKQLSSPQKLQNKIELSWGLESELQTNNKGMLGQA